MRVDSLGGARPPPRRPRPRPRAPRRQGRGTRDAWVWGRGAIRWLRCTRRHRPGPGAVTEPRALCPASPSFCPPRPGNPPAGWSVRERPSASCASAGRRQALEGLRVLSLPDAHLPPASAASRGSSPPLQTTQGPAAGSEVTSLMGGRGCLTRLLSDESLTRVSSGVPASAGATGTCTERTSLGFRAHGPGEGWDENQMIPNAESSVKISGFIREVFGAHNVLNFNIMDSKEKYFLCSRKPLLCFGRIFQ